MIRRYKTACIALAIIFIIIAISLYIQTTKNSTIDQNTVSNTPELFFGSIDNSALANGEIGRTGYQLLRLPKSEIPHKLYLEGDWDIMEAFARNKTAGSEIRVTYTGQNVFMKLQSDDEVRVQIFRDDSNLLQENAGADIVTQDGKSYIIVKKAKRYHLISENDSSTEPHTLKLIILAPELKASSINFR